jgi:hypothetical protein
MHPVRRVARFGKQSRCSRSQGVSVGHHANPLSAGRLPAKDSVRGHKPWINRTQGQPQFEPIVRTSVVLRRPCQKHTRCNLARTSAQSRWQHPTCPSKSLAIAGPRATELRAPFRVVSRDGPATVAHPTKEQPPRLQQCGLTRRSRRGPTASRQAREAVGHIIRLAGLASCRCSRLNSNVRPHRRHPWHACTFNSQSDSSGLRHPRIAGRASSPPQIRNPKGCK